MTQTAIEALLRQKIGLEIKTIGSKKIAKAIEIRRLACRLPNLQTYLKQLQSSEQELLNLVENIVVPETSFLRHRESFAFLSHQIQTEWLSRHKDDPLRILSLACSTGEEPYSIAITLTELGLNPKTFQIDAVDINQKALHQARQAIYGNHSFRGNDWLRLKPYFRETSKGYQLCQSISSLVNFKLGNLLKPFFLRDKHYHIIFCRHVLIYLDSAARSQAINVLNRLLMNQGLVFVGAAEMGLFKTPQWVPIRYPYAFAYQKEVGSQKSEVRSRKSEVRSRKSEVGSRKLEVGSKNQLPITHYQLPITHHPLPITHHQLETTRSLANQGHLQQATHLCLSYIAQHPTNAQAYLLLGEIYQAEGNNELAEQYFQKAIYLEPKCDDALTHLALLREYRGDLSGAAVIKQRIQRLHQLTVDKL